MNDGRSRPLRLPLGPRRRSEKGHSPPWAVGLRLTRAPAQRFLRASSGAALACNPATAWTRQQPFRCGANPEAQPSRLAPLAPASSHPSAVSTPTLRPRCTGGLRWALCVSSGRRRPSRRRPGRRAASRARCPSAARAPWRVRRERNRRDADSRSPTGSSWGR